MVFIIPLVPREARHRSDTEGVGEYSPGLQSIQPITFARRRPQDRGEQSEYLPSATLFTFPRSVRDFTNTALIIFRPMLRHRFQPAAHVHFLADVFDVRPHCFRADA